LEDSLDYQKMSQVVDSADAESAQVSETIDISEVLSNRLAIKKLNYADVSARIDTSGARRPEAEPEVQQRNVPEQFAVPKHELTGERVSAAERLRSMAGGVGKEFGESVEKIERKVAKAERAEKEKAGGEKLVMPQLSPQDQLSDLEKIEEGIGEGVFNGEQLKIIKQEVKALSSNAPREDTKGMNDEQREVAALINRRVKEIKAELNIR
jgi:uncharacterized protein YoaH (UPF0181 family)